MRTITLIASIFFTSILSAQQIGDGLESQINDFTVPLKSGGYQAYLPTGMNPDSSFGWQHLFVVRQ